MNNENKTPEPTETRETQHAMLVIWGIFAQRIGLVEKINEVKLSQKTREHTPQKKVLEFLVSILAGYEHLKDISLSAHPLDEDKVVAEAWGHEEWADYSGVSRTLASLKAEETDELIEVMQEIERPYREEEIAAALCRGECLIYDADLTGRSVSSTSESYPDAAFGHMGDSVELGYQAALVCMASQKYGRLWLSNKLHPGDTVSVTEAKALVMAAEASTRVRPRRRIELAQEQLRSAEAELAELQNQASESEERIKAAKWNLHDAQLTLNEAQRQFSTYTKEYKQEGRTPTTHCKLTRAKQKMETYQKRLPRSQQQLDVANRRFERHQTQFQKALLQVEEQRIHCQQLAADNQNNPCPVRVILRIDAGFSSQENIQWLIEMGYDVFTKDRGTNAKNLAVDALPPEAVWEAVGRNATMAGIPTTTLGGHFTYPLDVALVRYQLGETQRQSLLLHFGLDDVTDDLKQWFQSYNGRQTIEAGIKEGKSVFQMHHLKVRSPEALRLQEHLASFAANFVRFAALWLEEQSIDFLPFDTSSVKQMVSVCAHTSASVSRNGDSWLLTFSDHSCFAGHTIRIGNGPIQLPLPLLFSFQFSHF